MRPNEVVFDKPFGQFAVENVWVGGKIAKIKEFFFQRLIESLADGIVFRSVISGPVLIDVEFDAGLDEFLVKFGTVVV